MPHLLVIIIIGAIAGWIAGALVDADNSSILLDILIGIVGGFIGYKLFGNMLNITDNVYVNEVITATAGAAILAFIIKLIRRGGRSRD